jgi:DNA-binding NarL/FixJ family response regulator
LTKERAVFLGIEKQGRDHDDEGMEALTLLQRPLSRALAYREALNGAVMQLQHAGDAAFGSQPLRPRLGGDLQVAPEVCREFQPTRRQAEVLVLAAAGWTNRQIGTRLGITERTVRKHLTDVYDQAGLVGGRQRQLGGSAGKTAD